VRYFTNNQMVAKASWATITTPFIRGSQNA
jgi:hypothetical protein